MDWLAIVSLTVGTISILAAIAAITLSVLIHIKTQGVLADIKERAAVIEETVKGTQGKLLEAVTAIAVPPKASEQEMLMQMLGPILASNPSSWSGLCRLPRLNERSLGVAVERLLDPRR